MPLRQGHFRELKTEAFVADPYRLRHNRRNLKVIERVLVPGDAIVVWGTVREQEGVRRIWARRISDSQTYPLYGAVLVAIASFIVTYICLGIVLSSLGLLFFQ
ncbi:hypothetical protein [Leptolyngbya sp. PCC 6406]|uniref:hypothetical protein n=1 Tax=Leptolyngbya sp. PCC 6406 TaxID=1173264 RepID=UPI0002ABF910|nr:hypothetical protein [Leptolyngbya sp. PCC 6406]